MAQPVLKDIAPSEATPTTTASSTTRPDWRASGLSYTGLSPALLTGHTAIVPLYPASCTPGYTAIVPLCPTNPVSPHLLEAA